MPASPYEQMYFEPLTTPPKIGDVVMFSYNKIIDTHNKKIRDNKPLLLVLSSPNDPKYIKGINLHYLTYNVMGMLIEKANRQQIQNYTQVKGFSAMCALSFRTYLRNWIVPGSLRKMSLVAIQSEINTIKVYGKTSHEALDKVVQEQMQAKKQQFQASQMKGTVPGVAPVAGTPASIPAIGAPTNA